MPRDIEKAYLCVGGPLAGKRYAILYGDSFLVAKMDGMLANRPLPDRDVAVEEKLIRYFRMAFPTDGGGHCFYWVPEGQTATETQNLLAVAYERSPE